MKTAKQSEVTSTPLPRRIIRASAGTGKTFRLSNWFLSQLFAGARLDQLLATTFTRKAAREILDRILVRLANASLDTNAAIQLGEFVGIADLSTTRCLDLLTEMTQQLHRMRVSTLDSFFSQIATHCSLDLGLPPGWTIIDHNDDRQLQRDAIELLLQDNENNDLVRLFHLVTVGESNRSITKLLETAIDRAYSFYLETDEAAWQKLPEYHPLSPSDLARTFEDFDHFDIPKTKKGTNNQTWEKDFRKANRAVERGDWEGFLKTSIAERVLAGETHYSRVEIDASTRDVYDRLIRQARGTIVPQMAQQTHALYCLLDRFHHFYSQLKQDRRWQTYDDITRRLGQAVQAMNLEQVAYRLDSKIQHLLLDEFQDTSLSQWEILRPFAKQVCSNHAKQGGWSFFCVGDIKQAIYSWRGGVAEIFDAVEDELSGLNVESLELSRRSSQPVIDLVNRVFASDSLAEHPKLNDIMAQTIEAWTTRFNEHKTVETSVPGYCCLKTAPSAEEQNLSRRDGEEVVDATQNRINLKYAAKLVQDLSEQSPSSTIGILCRRNKSIAELMFELREIGIDASEEGGNPLTDSAVVQGILLLLRLIDHPGNTNAAFHVATSPLGKIVGLIDFSESEHCHQVAYSLRRQISEIGLASVFEGWFDRLAAFCTPRDLRRLRQLIELARTSPASRSIRTSEFVEVVENERVEDPSSGLIRVMTIHKSKGLEFDIVVLPELDVTLNGFAPKVVAGRPTPTSRPDRVSVYRNKTIQKLLPDDFQRVFETWTREGVTQSMCMLYVALTRARHANYLVIAPSARKEFSLPTNISGLLRWALLQSKDAVMPEETLFDTGDPEWYIEVENQRAARNPTDDEQNHSDPAPSGSPSVKPTSRIELAPMPTGRLRGLSSLEPSTLEGAETVRINELLSLDRAERMERGSLMHRWFEEIEWLDDGPPDEGRLRLLAGAHTALGIDIDDEICQFDQFLRNATTANALQKAQYLNGLIPLRQSIVAEIVQASPRLEVQREWGFAAPGEDGELVSGVIDRLVLMYHPSSYQLLAADIIDYKTDEVTSPDAITQRVAFYREQLQAYREAVSKLYRLDAERIAARLLFVNAGEIREVYG